MAGAQSLRQGRSSGTQRPDNFRVARAKRRDSDAGRGQRCFVPVLTSFNQAALIDNCQKQDRGNASMRHRRLFGLLAAFSVWLFLVPGVQAQSVGPDYPDPPSIEYRNLYRDVELASVFP